MLPYRIEICIFEKVILHGRYTCIARKPRCGACLIEDLCEFKDKTEN